MSMWKKHGPIWFLILAVVLISGVMLTLSNQKISFLNKQISALQSEIAVEQNSSAKLQSQSDLLRETNEQFKEFFKKRTTAVSLIDSSLFLYRLGNINFEDAQEYDSLTTILYNEYEINAYDPSLHVEKLNTASQQVQKAVVAIKKASKELTGLVGETPDDFWASELALRLRQAEVLTSLYNSQMALIESEKLMQRYAQNNDAENGKSELNRYNNILVPAFNQELRESNDVFIDINIFWDEDLYAVD